MPDFECVAKFQIIIKKGVLLFVVRGILKVVIIDV